MSVRTDQGVEGGVFFCTFTCFRWQPLFEAVSMYGWIHDWFRRLHGEGNSLVAYVIMPNHLHMLLHVPEGKSINKILGEGKRFMAYEIRKRLKIGGHNDLLAYLAEGVRSCDTARGQRYRIFRPSSDIKHCWSRKFLWQKLEYIHNNPVSGGWSLAEEPGTYPYSSAGYYQLGSEPIVPLVHIGNFM